MCLRDFRIGNVRRLGAALCASLVLLTGMAFAQTAAEPHNVVQLSANGTLEAPQDFLTLSLSTSRDGSDAGTVQTQVRQTVDNALHELKKNAQPGAMEVHSGNFSLRPRYGNDGRINGWSGSAEIIVEGTDFARIAAAAGRTPGMVVGGLNFGLSRQARTQLEAQAQTLAINAFKARASEIAHGFGFADYSLREVSVGMGEQPLSPMPRPMLMAAKTMGADAALPLEGGKSLVVVTVSGTIQLK